MKSLLNNVHRHPDKCVIDICWHVQNEFYRQTGMKRPAHYVRSRSTVKMSTTVICKKRPPYLDTRVFGPYNDFFIYFYLHTLTNFIVVGQKQLYLYTYYVYIRFKWFTFRTCSDFYQDFTHFISLLYTYISYYTLTGSPHI